MLILCSGIDGPWCALLHRWRERSSQVRLDGHHGLLSKTVTDHLYLDILFEIQVGFLTWLVHDAVGLWGTDASTNTIDRVELSELDFPAVSPKPEDF